MILLFMSHGSLDGWAGTVAERASEGSGQDISLDLEMLGEAWTLTCLFIGEIGGRINELGL